MPKLKFSIVIALAPNRNAEILQSLKNLNYSKNKYELIVKKGLNPSENRNSGVRDAKAEIVAFLDDDAFVHRDILKKVEVFFEKHPEIDIVGGPQLTPREQKGFGKISGYALESIFGGSGIRKRYKKGKLNLNADETFLTSSNLFCKKRVFKKVKFNPLLFPGEDPDFIQRAKESKFKIAYSPDIFIYHKRRETITGLAKQVFSYGKTRLMKESIFQTMKRPFFLIPSIFIIYLFFLLILNLNLITGYAVSSNDAFIKISFLTSSLLFLYLLLNIFFSLYISVKEKNINAFFILIPTFLIIHFSYGLGMINTFFKKVKKI